MSYRSLVPGSVTSRLPLKRHGLAGLETEVELPASDVVTAVARLRLEEEIRLRGGAYGLAARRGGGNKPG